MTIYFAFVGVFLYLAIVAMALPSVGRMLKRRREELQALDGEIHGAPEGAFPVEREMLSPTGVLRTD